MTNHACMNLQIAEAQPVLCKERRLLTDKKLSGLKILILMTDGWHIRRDGCAGCFVLLALPPHSRHGCKELFVILGFIYILLIYSIFIFRSVDDHAFPLGCIISIPESRRSKRYLLSFSYFFCCNLIQQITLIQCQTG